MENESKPRVEYRQLGKSGLRVSVPILGAMSFGDKRWGVGGLIDCGYRRCRLTSYIVWIEMGY